MINPNFNQILNKALEALKESQELKTFRVIDTLTGEVVDPNESTLHFAIEEKGSLILIDECGGIAYCPEGRFKVVWDE